MNGIFSHNKTVKAVKTRGKSCGKTVPLYRVALLLILMVCSQTQAIAPERVVWNKHPIAVALRVGEERLIHFPDDVRYWLPDYLSNAVTVLAVNGVMYITAHREFDTTRIRVQSLNNRTIYLLDVSASVETHSTTELIVMTAASTANQAKSYPSENDLPDNHLPDNNHADNKRTSRLAFDWFIRLTRYVAQSLYAQERLLPSDRGIYEVRLAEPNPIPLIRGGHIRAIPIKSWRGGGYYLTAVKIQNMSDHKIDIIHKSNTRKNNQQSLVLSRDLRGDWLAVTPQHTTLGARNHQDVSTLYLLSQRSFGESLQ